MLVCQSEKSPLQKNGLLIMFSQDYQKYIHEKKLRFDHNDKSRWQCTMEAFLGGMNDECCIIVCVKSAKWLKMTENYHQ